jgi:phosphatidylethanolamine-binding protein (PEBP) family uncharacterized protein
VKVLELFAAGAEFSGRRWDAGRFVHGTSPKMRDGFCLGLSPIASRASAPSRNGGPSPPAGDKPHHYQITVVAVDVDKLPDAKNDAASALVSSDLRSHTLAKATLTRLYGR